MKRFRFTLLAVFLLPLCLGVIDLRLVLSNTEPQAISSADLLEHGLPREWVVIEEATLDLTRAINLSGELPIEVLFVPLADNHADTYQVWIETRDPRFVTLVSRYETGFDSVFAKQAFFEENRARFFPTGNIHAMAADWISANPNRENLAQLLAAEGELPLPAAELKERMILLSQDKQPAPVRGSFYFISGLAGLVLVMQRWRRDARKAGATQD